MSDLRVVSQSLKDLAAHTNYVYHLDPDFIENSEFNEQFTTIFALQTRNNFRTLMMHAYFCHQMNSRAKRIETGQ